MGKSGSFEEVPGLTMEFGGMEEMGNTNEKETFVFTNQPFF